MALIAIEMNFNTGPIEELERLQYPNQYTREIQDSNTGKMRKAYGWRTDGITRPRMIDEEVAQTKYHLDLFFDIRTLQEMLTFVYDENNRPDAMSGAHDDLLISDCILHQVRHQQDTVAITPTQRTDAFGIYGEDIDDDYDDFINS